ncbi:major facilitator superfamily domain-containing protein [Triangularia verruculosa]|uniref:Major facilitator superfamily domain-containing protein n=1 Tax=Triangularia verruculosa TaxID=2587418 RepID=A0AAN7ARL8_9PEZI|nr:major facilitator superfamily domain-containing protein [Triangularia verruculosa]
MANHKNGGPKLPVQQLAILAIARFAEPLALTSVFPYLPEMIESFGVEKNEVARWAGFTGAIFSISQSCTAVAWGRASDTFGRKPIILVGLLSTMICFLVWGMSTNLSMAIATRAIMGGGNGNVGIIRTMVAEMVPERVLQPKAFSLMPLVWSIGSVFGPAFGGFFAQPAKQFPNVFGDSEFFKRYPFALPNIMACCVFFISFMTGLLFLKETLESKRNSRDWGLELGEKLTRPFHRKTHTKQFRRRSFVDSEASAPLLAQSTLSSSSSSVDAKHSDSVSMKDIFAPQTTINLICYTFLALHSVAYDQVLPVFLNYPRVIPDEHNTSLPFKFTGGFGLSSDKIGTIYTVYGIACGVIQFFLFPKLCARFGVLGIYRFATIIFPIIYFLTPYTALVQSTTWRYIFFLTIMLVKGFVVIVAFPCTTILLTNSATSLRILGTLNGVATTFSGLGRAVGPAAAGAVFSWGVQRGYVIAAWWFLGLIALMGTIPPWFIVEGEGPTASSTATTSEDEEEEESLLQRDDDDDDDSVDGYDEVAVLEAIEGNESESESEGVRKKKVVNGGYGTMRNGTSSS